MSAQKPTLADLGLDEPAEKSPFGKAFDNYEPAAEDHAKTWVDSVKLPATGPSDLLAAIFAFFFGPVGLWYKHRWAEGFSWLFTCLLLVPFVVWIPYLNVAVAFICWLAMIIHAFVADPK